MPEQKSAPAKLRSTCQQYFSRHFRLSLAQVSLRPSRQKRRKWPKGCADRRQVFDSCQLNATQSNRKAHGNSVQVSKGRLSSLVAFLLPLFFWRNKEKGRKISVNPKRTAVFAAVLCTLYSDLYITSCPCSSERQPLLRSPLPSSRCPHPLRSEPHRRTSRCRREPLLRKQCTSQRSWSRP